MLTVSTLTRFALCAFAAVVAMTGWSNRIQAQTNTFEETGDCSDCHAEFYEQSGESENDDEPEEWRLFQRGIAEKFGFTLEGHLGQGLTTNSRNPNNPSEGGTGNAPGTFFNYLNDDYMFNQLFFELDRPTDTSDGGWDVGAHAEILYGTDYYLLQSRGLETDGDFGNHWNSDTGTGLEGNGLMGIAIPQIYADIAYDKWMLRLGHFLSPLGYESPLPTQDTFYSNTFGFSYNFEAAPITGMFLNRKVNDCLEIGAGIHRGMLNWQDNNNDLNGFFVLKWASCDKLTSFEYVLDIGDENDAGDATRFLQSIVFERELTDCLSYVFHSDVGSEQDLAPGGATATWYNIVNEVSYKLNDKLVSGVRYEWFDDADGVIIEPTPGPGIYNGLTFGLNYLPCSNITVRPEIRWDWFNADAGVGPGPYGDGEFRDQFMTAVDVVFTF